MINTLGGKTYIADRPIFKKLGLETFENAPHAKPISVGKFETEDGSCVEIHVECWPTQFWTFDIYQAEGDRNYVLTTGSGALSSYWPTVEKLMGGMINIDVEKEKGR